MVAVCQEQRRDVTYLFIDQVYNTLLQCCTKVLSMHHPCWSISSYWRYSLNFWTAVQTATLLPTHYVIELYHSSFILNLIIILINGTKSNFYYYPYGINLHNKCYETNPSQVWMFRFYASLYWCWTHDCKLWIYWSPYPSRCKLKDCSSSHSWP